MKMKIQPLTLFALILFILVEPAYAYLDGATFSFVLQTLAAFFIGGLIVFKSTYKVAISKIKAIFSNLKFTK